MITGNISKFLLIKKKQKISLYCWSLQGNKKNIVDLKKKFFFLVGYKHNKLSLDGEFISIDINKKITIKNDIYGSHNIYYYKNKNKEIISNSLDEIFKLKLNISISKKNIYKYFSFGFLPLSQDTIYNQIKLIERNSKIEVFKNLKIVSFDTNLFKRQKITIDEAKKDFIKLFKKKIYKIELEKAVLCLTAGYDTLLSLVYTKKKLNLATFGNYNSFDVLGAKRRKKIFVKNQKHYVYLTKNYALKEIDFLNYSSLLGGFANLSSIEFMNYINFLKKNNIKFVYHSDHFETARRNYSNLSDLKKKYLTPINVVKKYFINQKQYNYFKDKFFKKIKLQYKKNEINKFYLFDRFIKGNFWKNQVYSSLGLIKISLPLEFRFINNNFNLLKKNKENKFFFNLFPKKKNILNELNSVREVYSKNKDRSATNQIDILNYHKEYFYKILNKKYSKQFSSFFNLDLIKKSLKENHFVEKEEWFLLRLFSLIIFSNKYRIKIK